MNSRSPALAGQPDASSGARLRHLFAYPFRIFFVSVGVMAVLVMPLWLSMLWGAWRPVTFFDPLSWHRHEMLFGFLEAAIAGFLMTAVCTWTGTVRLHGARLLALWLVWLAGRVLMLVGGDLPGWLVSGIELAFLPLVMLDAGPRILGARQWRQLPILGVLAALWAMDVGFHAQPQGPWAHGAMLMAMTLMLVIGGRITPAFSVNWLRLSGGNADAMRIYPSLERLLLALMLAMLLSTLLPVPRLLAGSIALAAAAVSALRITLWQGWRVRGEPLLWILHVSLAFVPVSLLLLAGARFGCVASTAWVHAAGVGAMASLILGVMARVALGHTGRPLRLPSGMTLAFCAILCAGALRVTTALGALPWRSALLAVAALWAAAYGIYLGQYWRALASPRADGKEG